MSASESVDQLAHVGEHRLTRRSAIGKLRYAPPAIAALGVLRPEVALGRSGPGKPGGYKGKGNGKDIGKGKGKGKGKDKGKGKGKGW